MEDGRQRLKSNAYPGRGIITGLDAAGRHVLQVYWLMGRSAGSKNRILVNEGDDVLTQPFEEAGRRTDDPNIYYRAIARTDDLHVVSNGSHTDLLIEHFAAGGAFEDGVRRFDYETDAPNFTPRIAGLADLRAEHPVLYLANAVRGSTVDTLHSVYTYGRLEPGRGYCLHTYADDGNPVPSFTERPYEIDLLGNPEDAAASIWDLLAPDKRVSLAVKAIDVRTRQVAISLRNTLG